MRIRRFAALGIAVCILCVASFYIPLAFDYAAYAHAPQATPISLASSSVAVMYFLPVFEKSMSFEPMRRSILADFDNSFCIEYIPDYIFEMYFPKQAPGNITASGSICPRAP